MVTISAVIHVVDRIYADFSAGNVERYAARARSALSRAAHITTAATILCIGGKISAKYIVGIRAAGTDVLAGRVIGTIEAVTK